MAIAERSASEMSVSGLSRGVPGEDQREAELARKILGYLAERPQASDTLQGIAEWWVMQYTIRVEVNAVARVLRRLRDDGFLEQVGMGENPVYQLRNRDFQP
jgi:hypothetical protein